MIIFHEFFFLKRSKKTQKYVDTIMNKSQLIKKITQTNSVPFSPSFHFMYFAINKISLSLSLCICLSFSLKILTRSTKSIRKM